MSVCKKCGGTTWILYKDENGREYGKPCECREAVIAAGIMRSSGISEGDLKKGFSEFQTFGEDALSRAKNTAISYFKAFNDIKDQRVNSILLCGASGRGKTTLGMAIANNLMKSGTGVMYMPYRDEITTLKQEITDEYNYTTHMNRLKNASVLFIDDLLKGKITESDVNIMYEIINYRYLQRKPLIISTEKTVPELIAFDEAIGSRLVEMSKDFVVTFDKSIMNYRLR